MMVRIRCSKRLARHSQNPKSGAGGAGDLVACQCCASTVVEAPGFQLCRAKSQRGFSRTTSFITGISLAAIWLGFFLAFGSALLWSAQNQTNQSASATESVNSEPDPSRRAEHALSLAESAFSNARGSYDKGQIKAGDERLDEMIKLLNLCAASLDASHKSRNYKPAEIRVKSLMRRLKTLIFDLSVEDRGWAEYTARQLEEIHDKLLNGVMKK